MRIMPFMKRKKGLQFAGIGLDTGGGGSYVLPPATSENLGGVKVGNGLDVAQDGTLSASGGGGFDFPIAETKVGKVGNADLYCQTIIGYGDTTYEVAPAPSGSPKLYFAFGSVGLSQGNYDFTLGYLGSAVQMNEYGIYLKAPSGFSTCQYRFTVFYTK